MKKSEVIKDLADSLMRRGDEEVYVITETGQNVSVRNVDMMGDIEASEPLGRASEVEALEEKVEKLNERIEALEAELAEERRAS